MWYKVSLSFLLISGSDSLSNQNKQKRDGLHAQDTIHIDDHTFAPTVPGTPGTPSFPAGPWTETRGREIKQWQVTERMCQYRKTERYDAKLVVDPFAIPSGTHRWRSVTLKEYYIFLGGVNWALSQSCQVIRSSFLVFCFTTMLLTSMHHAHTCLLVDWRNSKVRPILLLRHTHIRIT